MCNGIHSMLRLFSIVGVAVMTATLIACDNPTHADKANFQLTLQRHYDTYPICISIASNLPIELPEEREDIKKQQMEALTRAGLVSAESVRKTESNVFGSQERMSQYLRYRPTEAGAAVVRPGADRFIGGTQICFAKRRVIEIMAFTEPKDVLGVKTSRVTYRYDFKDIEPWAYQEDIQAAFPGIARVLNNLPDSQTDTLVLMKDKWIHERATR